ncbi:Na/Pi cotransporter family protein [Pseudohalocynthiibacter aestuariivivens]|jgi:phosphate:Na+ symporter|uniref:Na/Pi cotransporter family protein n=1 Tax=Pseudohalocynthiibacter aestuariivivens TaxID=1591409 RepID=A0ABV5JHB0_9RHOB|nr:MULTISPECIES: Na/Pi cotransporter family protein [Pseudohalocynthiibacter]MBS9717812.1 Na/Pi cotransporter family protein [Pseudohalocynthiibacter aestuariivivens]MCK0103038.1 Na/Pi cotransporter family protein [Pseudohalocynthiibacter sp. F2068]
MAILGFLINLAGATMLLLFAVRMVRTGIERGFGASFQRILTEREGLLGASSAGLGLAVVLQSSAAVALLVAGFSASGVLSFGTGLAVVLGGDLGSALIIQILSFRLDWLVPLLLAAGGWLFVNSDQRRLRQYGRIVMGIAFILISLRFLREAMDPIRESDFLPAIAEYLARDYLTAFLVGAALAFVMHSSVATILMCVTLVAIGAIPLEAGISLVLGANLGSAIIPIWLSRGMSPLARRVPFANFLLRGSWALVTLFLVNLLPVTTYLSMMGPAQTLINTHIAFNLSLLLLALPFVRKMGGVAEIYFPDEVAEAGITLAEPISALDRTVLDNPRLALASLKREILRMSELVERMAHPVMEVYESGDSRRISELIALDQQVNKTRTGVRRYVAEMSTENMSKLDVKLARELADYAINLGMAGDTVAKRLLPLAREVAKKELRFSKAGWSELVSMHECVISNMRLASNVLVSDDLESARLLIAEKAEIARVESKSRKRHLKRLSEGGAVSFESSDVHLETLRGLKDLNSQCSAVAYPLLYRNGQLLETRLIETLDDADAEI